MGGDERRRQLAEYLARQGYADLSVLVAELGVSESTVRRDLSQLEEERIARRTHGGAVFVSDRLSALNYSERESAAVAEKEAIGRLAASLVGDSDTILLDGGTTTYQVARHLMTRSLQVVTNSLPIANLLANASSIELIFVGGYIYPRTGVALGPIATQTIEALNVSKAFMGLAGITEDALYNANMLMVETEQQMMRCADEVIVVADHTKFGKRGLAQLGGWNLIDRMITDAGVEPKWRDILHKADVELIVAEVAESAASPARSGFTGNGGAVAPPC